MILELPFQPAIPAYRFSTSMAGNVYLFDVRWNARDDAWYFDMSDDQNVPIVSGVKIVLGILLGGRSRDPRFPDGAMFAMDLTGKGEEAKLEDLGIRLVVLHITSDEFA